MNQYASAVPALKKKDGSIGFYGAHPIHKGCMKNMKATDHNFIHESFKTRSTLYYMIILCVELKTMHAVNESGQWI